MEPHCRNQIPSLLKSTLEFIIPKKLLQVEIGKHTPLIFGKCPIKSHLFHLASRDADVFVKRRAVLKL
eukprot:2640503-Rhodomonas_salina.1